MSDIYCPDCDEDLASGHDPNCPTLKPEKIYELTLCDGVEGQSLYLDDTRIAGPKPWGGGTVVKTWEVRARDLENAISRPRQ